MELLLVNNYSPLPEDYKPKDLIDLKDIPDRCFDLAKDSFRLDRTAAKALNSMLMEAANAGFIGFKITDAYRTREYQDRLYRSLTDGIAAKPGHSEHETGLAVDISNADVRIDTTKPGSKDIEGIDPLDWLADHCQNYGYILRYPEYKEELTGIRYEPWHFRYVGLRVAKYLKNHDLCLEEYCEQKFGIPIVKTDLTKDLRTRETLVWNFLLEKIHNPYGAAALMGNLRAESELRSEVLQFEYHKEFGYDSIGYTDAVDSGEYKNFENDCAGYGIAQWTLKARKKGLLEYSKRCNKSVGDLEMQLEYLWHELCTDYIVVKNALVNATSIREASDEVVDKFERPFDPTEDLYVKRASFGKRFYYNYITKEQLDAQLSKMSLWREDISFYLMNYNNSEVLYERNSDKVRPVGSITKIMTIYVLAKKIFSKNRINEYVRIDQETSDISKDARYSGGEFLAAGECYTVDMLLKLSLGISACASTIALVRHFYGDEEKAVKEMNKEAKTLKLSAHFEDVIGTDPRSVASARDVAVIGSNLIKKYPRILDYTSQKEVHFNNQDYQCTSRILRDGEVEGLDGLKTGTTPSAGKCYLATAGRKNHRVISVVLNAQENEERYSETIELLEYGLAKAND